MRAIVYKKGEHVESPNLDPLCQPRFLQMILNLFPSLSCVLFTSSHCRVKRWASFTIDHLFLSGYFEVRLLLLKSYNPEGPQLDVHRVSD